MKRLKQYGLALMTGVLMLSSAASANAQATDAKVKNAMRLIDLGNARQAIEDLQAQIAQERGNAEAHAALAIAYLDMNNLGGANSEAQAGFDISRNNTLVRIARGMVFGRQKNVKGALDEFNTAIKQNDKDIGAYLALSRYYLSIDSLKRAEVTLYRAQQLNDKDVRPYIGLAELYERQRSIELAINQYQEALKNQPNDVSAMAHLASMYFRARRYNESVNEWIQILRVDSTYPDAYYQIGNLYFLANQPQNAAAYANRYVQMKPNDVYGQWLLAQSLTEIGQYQQALPALEKVSANDSLKALSQILIGRGYFYSKDYPKAIQTFQNAKGMEPKDYTLYGVALFNSGDTTGAITQLRQSLVNDTIRTPLEKQNVQQQIASWLWAQKRFEEAGKTFSDLADAYPTVAWNLAAAQTYAFAKRPDLEAQYIDRALKIDPNSLPAYWQIAMGSVSNLGSDTALTRWEKVASLGANSKDTAGVAYGFIGYHYAARKDWDKAADYLDKALTNLRDSKSPYLENFETTLGQSYLQLKDVAKAEPCFNRVLRINPNSKAAKEGLDYIQKVKAAGSSEPAPKKKK